MWQYDLALDKYCVTQSGYFRLATEVVLGTCIKYGRLLFWHGISERSADKKLSTREYKRRTVYDCLNNTFPSDFVILDLNLPPIAIDDRLQLDKRAWYAPDLLPDAISVASENMLLL